MGNGLFARPLSGVIQYQENNKTYPLSEPVFFENTTIGTVTDIEGAFRLERLPETDLLIISYIGYKTDTLKITTPFISHQMIQNQEDELDEVTQPSAESSQKSFRDAKYSEGQQWRIT